MPGWHADTIQFQRSGALQMLGIIQEQHPDRCALFMQWKQMDWPVLVDSLNLYGIEIVPVTYAIDEYGVLRYVNPSREQFKTFMATSFEAPPRAALVRADLTSSSLKRAPDAMILRRPG